MNLTYTDYFTKEELRKRGYNLESDGVLDISHFDSINDAIDDFMNTALRAIYNLCVQYKGRNWADAFFHDMALSDLDGVALDCKQRLNLALIEQAIYIYDNGDSNASSNREEYKERSPYAPKAVVELWDILSQ